MAIMEESQLLHFIIIVIAWVGTWQMIESIIAFFFPAPTPGQTFIIYTVIAIIGLSLYALSTPPQIIDGVDLGGRIIL